MLRRLVLPAVLAAALCLLSSPPLRAGVLHWDANTSLSGAQGGSGTWSAAGDNWWDPLTGSNAAWINDGTSDAYLTTPEGGIITLGEDVRARFLYSPSVTNGQAYTIRGDASLHLGAGGIDLLNTRSVTIESNVVLTANQVWQAQGNNVLTVSGDVSESGGARALTKGRIGTLVLTGDNTYSGGTVLGQGTLGIGSDTALGTGVLEFTGAADVEAVGGPRRLNNGLYVFLGSNTTKTANFIGSEDLTFAGDFGIKAGVNDGTFVFNVTGSGDVTLEGAIAVTIGTQPRNIEKRGGGRLILDGDSTYAGQTRLRAGTLLVNGTTTGQGDYLIGGPTIEASVRLGGEGSIGLASGKTFTVEGTADWSAAVGPGRGIGTLRVGTSGAGNTVLFGDYGVLGIDIADDGSCDLLAVDGDLDLSSLLDRLTVTGTPGGMSYQILTYTGQRTGEFTLTDLPAGYAVDYTQANSVWLIVPEPATLALLAMGGVALLRRRG